MSLYGGRGPAGSRIPKGYSAGSMLQYTPEQMNLFKSLFSQVSPESQLSQRVAGSDVGFAPYEDYATRQFQKFSGDLASRFSGMGMGARNSSGFKNLATQGAQDFASQLAMQRQELQRQALQDLLGISHTLLGAQPYQNFLIQKQPRESMAGKLLGAGLPIAGAAIGGAFGGPAGAMIGSGVGSAAASGFKPARY